MRNTIKSYLEAAKARKENGEEGFSLVELIIVVVILGILAAIAIPIFNGIQAQARQSAVEAAAANAVSQAAAQLAASQTPTLPNGNGDFTYAWEGGVPNAVDNICVTATHTQGPESASRGTRAQCP